MVASGAGLECWNFKSHPQLPGRGGERREVGDWIKASG